MIAGLCNIQRVSMIAHVLSIGGVRACLRIMCRIRFASCLWGCWRLSHSSCESTRRAWRPVARLPAAGVQARRSAVGIYSSIVAACRRPRVCRTAPVYYCASLAVGVLGMWRVCVCLRCLRCEGRVRSACCACDERCRCIVRAERAARDACADMASARFYQQLLATLAAAYAPRPSTAGNAQCCQCRRRPSRGRGAARRAARTLGA